MSIDYYLNMKYKETEDSECYEFYPDGEIKEKLPHRISRFGYYNLYSDMDRSPILFYENEYYKGIFFALTLNSNGLFHLDVWVKDFEYSKLHPFKMPKYNISSYNSEPCDEDIFTWIKSINSNRTDEIALSFYNEIESVFLNSREAMEVLNDSDSFSYNAFTTFINETLKYYNLNVSVDLRTALSTLTNK